MTTADTWNGLTHGDMFTVVNERGTRYKFLSVEVDDLGEVRWINAVGGRIGRAKKDGGDTRTWQLRTFRPERIQVPQGTALARQRQQRQARTKET